MKFGRLESAFSLFSSHFIDKTITPLIEKKLSIMKTEINGFCHFCTFIAAFAVNNYDFRAIPDSNKVMFSLRKLHLQDGQLDSV